MVGERVAQKETNMISKNSAVRLCTVALLSALFLQLTCNPALAEDFDHKILFYDQSTGEGEVGVIESDNFRTLSYLGPGSFLPWWTHVASDGFFYNQYSGDGALVTVHYGGGVETLWHKSGVFASWTSITSHEGYLLFFQSWSGKAVIGRA